MPYFGDKKEMTATQSEIVNRCRKLGLQCDEIPADSMSSALAALSCFPMYMVANVDAWTSDSQWRVPIIDFPGSEHIREAFAAGKLEGELKMDKEHRRVLGSLVSHAKPCDLIAYEYALETLRIALPALKPSLADEVRSAIARMIVKVAEASGEGFLGSGPKVSPQEKACIDQINDTLSLSQSEAAAAILADVGR
jgi:hypothetical protein